MTRKQVLTRSRRILGLCIVALSLNACASNDLSQAGRALSRMKVEQYFSNPSQVALLRAIKIGDLQQAERLVAEGASVDGVGKEGMTPLFWTLSQQDQRGFRFLLEKGASANRSVSYADERGRLRMDSAMHLAATIDDDGFLNALLEHGGDPNLVVEQDGWPPIYRSILHQRNRSVELLIKYGADINFRDISGKTPINYAVSMNHYSIALLLMRMGGDPKIKNKWGFSAIDTARQFGARGYLKREDEVAFPQFIAELERRGLW